ncbi:hypothetical protein KBC79_04950, partial [Candidatus Woesebacteria bacterium]|nr:hypothetical protein [Candidatus Woesebacteria bacterium]
LYDTVNLAASISGSSDRLYAHVPILLLTDIVLKQQIISVYSALFRAIQYQLSHTSDSHPHLATILSELSTQLTTLIELEKSTTKRQQEVRHIR